MCRIDQEGACNTKENAYQATTHYTSLIEKNDSATRAYRQLKFLDECIEHRNVEDIIRIIATWRKLSEICTLYAKGTSV